MHVTISESEKKMEAAKSSLKQELQELQEKLNNSQLREQSEICTLKSQLAAYSYELHQEATAKEKLKAEMEIFKGNLSIQLRHFLVG